MALQIAAYKGYALPDRSGVAVLQMPDGPPIAVNATTFTGVYTVPDGCHMVKIKGTGTITWPTIATAEAFEGVEFRGVRPGQTFTVA